MKSKIPNDGLFSIIGPIYDILDFPYEILIYRKMRRKWISTLNNETILEIGVGTGENLPYYNGSNAVYALDREPRMLTGALKKKRKRHQRNIRLTIQPQIPWKLPAVKFTQVVATFVFCTMADPQPILDELANWVKKGTKLLLFEFIRPKHPKVQRLLEAINPIIKLLFGIDFSRPPTHDYLKGSWDIVKKTDIIHDFIIVIEAVKI